MHEARNNPLQVEQMVNADERVAKVPRFLNGLEVDTWEVGGYVSVVHICLVSWHVQWKDSANSHPSPEMTRAYPVTPHPAAGTAHFKVCC